jgi:hypothetical protein
MTPKAYKASTTSDWKAGDQVAFNTNSPQGKRAKTGAVVGFYMTEAHKGAGEYALVDCTDGAQRKSRVSQLAAS